MTSTKTIPLKDLAIWDGNVRKTEGSDTGLAELAASIQSIGIINPLTVVATGKTFAVVAGSRRLAALQKLLKAKAITGDYAVPVTLTDATTAIEVSIAENVIRENMHPADEFEAFLKLSKDGVSNEDIAAKFGVTAAVVAKRLKLANVSPKIFKAYRNNEIDLDCVMAYAVTDDIKAQERVWKSLGQYDRDNAFTVRRALTENEIAATDKRVKFVGLDAYTKAGGTTRADLFTEGDNGVFIADPDILRKLVTDKLAKVEKTVKAEGWAWVEVREKFDYSEKTKFKQVHQVESTLSDELEAEYRALDKEIDDYYDRDDDPTPEQEKRLNVAEKRKRKIDSMRKMVWPTNTLQVAGAVITVGHYGKSEIERGLVRPADLKKLQKPKKPAQGDDDGLPDIPEGPTLPQSLCVDLTKHFTAGLGVELMGRPDVALAAVVHNLVGHAFSDGYFGESCLEITAKTKLWARDVEGPANAAIEKQRAVWLKKLPKDLAGLWEWCLTQKQDTLLSLLAFCTALTVDAVGTRGRGDEHGDALAKALKLDMANWFTPTAENYFGRVSKDQIVSDLTEIGKGQLLDAGKTKKADAAKFAEGKAKGSRWVPELLRTPTDSAQEVKKAA